MADSRILVVLAAVAALAVFRPAFAQDAETAPSCCGRRFTVDGVGGHHASDGKVAGAAADLAGDTFADEVWGKRLVATVPDLPAGRYAVAVDCAEQYHRAAGERVFDVSVDGKPVATGLDLFAIDGFGHAHRVAATVDHAAGPLVVAVVAITGNATFNAIHVTGPDGKGVACVTARDLRPVEVPGADLVPAVPGPVRYTDVAVPPAERAADLVARLSLRERVAQLQNGAPAVPRVGLPAYNYWNECLHGIARAGDATVFPEPIGLAATFDVDAVHDMADAIATEARAKYNAERSAGIYRGLTFWSPNVNIFRDPRWGRGMETYGEDPYLTARMGVAFVRGLQGDDPRYLKVLATAKHFAVHSGPESTRHHFDAEPPERDLYETYLPQFEALVREGHVGSVMGAYNRTDGVPCCASAFLLQEVLRKRWGFDGYVVSDCGAITDIWQGHHAATGKSMAAGMAVAAGCDLECGGDYAALPAAVNAGRVTAAQIDLALTRVLTARFRLGMFDPPDRVPWSNVGADQLGSAAHAALAKRLADESLVLLKNDGGLLPLDRSKIKTIAVVGPNVDSVPVLYGNYNGRPRAAPTLLEAVRAKVGPGVQVIGLRGCPYARSAGDRELVPDVCLRHDDRRGLRAEYFTNPDLRGDPAWVRSDLTIDFCYMYTAAVANFPAERTSARWTGQFVAPADGAYALSVDCPEPHELILDGKPAGEPLKLTKGQAVDLRLEYHHTGQWARCALMWDRIDLDGTEQTVAAIRQADVVIFASGLTGDLEGEEGEQRRPLVGVDGDRAAIEMPPVQEELLRAVVATGRPTVLVNFSGGATAMPWAADHVPAILQAWYPGEAGATAVADAVFGDVNPSGHLPVTVYRSTADLPPFDSYAMAGRTYRYFAGKPLWAFGHGLSYSVFEAVTPRWGERKALLEGKRQAVAADGTVRVKVPVKSWGIRDGDAVVQAYVRRADPDEPRAGNPAQSLVSFARVRLDKRQQQTEVDLSFPAAALRTWSVAKQQYVVVPGDYDVSVGMASDEASWVDRVTVTPD